MRTPSPATITAPGQAPAFKGEANAADAMPTAANAAATAINRQMFLVVMIYSRIQIATVQKRHSATPRP